MDRWFLLGQRVRKGLSDKVTYEFKREKERAIWVGVDCFLQRMQQRLSAPGMCEGLQIEVASMK